jgi:N-acyl homoserine lactone hydrolase
MRVHVIQTGRLTGNERVMRAESWRAAFRRPARYEFPAFCFLLEHPEGLIAVDTGLTSAVRVPLLQRLLSVPLPSIEPDEEVGPGLSALGIDAGDVRTVVLTHLDWDHTGGLRYFPAAKVLVHRPEWEFGKKLRGRLRYQPKLWPEAFEPIVYDLDPEPYGPFPNSKAVTEAGDVRVVPIPGHSFGQVGVIVESGDETLFFVADHLLRQDWFLEDYAAGNLMGAGGALFFPKLAVETSRRVHALLEQKRVVLLPSHDAEMPARLEAREPARAG